MKKPIIYNTISDPSYYKDLLRWYENEEINQWLFYMHWGSKSYYDNKDNMYNKNEIFWDKDFESFSENLWLITNQKILLISLWCWKSDAEKNILKSHPNIDYIWVDTSNDMLDLSIKNLADIPNKQDYIRADFSSELFLTEIEALWKTYDKKIYAFFWWTFWNIKHTKIINILNNLLHKWEKIWLDIYTRRWKTISDDIDLHTKYKNWLEAKKQFFMNRLQVDWINENDWEIILESKQIEWLYALLFTYYFKFNKRKQINVRGENITFLPWSKLTVFKVYRFDPNGLINFFLNFDFNILDHKVKWYKWRFIFEKK